MSSLKAFFLLMLYFLLVGMKIILKDGNFIEVDNFNHGESHSQLIIHRQKINIPNAFIDLKSTLKLLEIEKKGISVLTDYSAIFYERKDVVKELISIKNEDKEEKKAFPILKLETRKDTSPFFMELPDSKMEDEDFVEKIKKKGIIFKFNIPVKSK